MTVRAEIRPIPEPPREVVLTMPYDVAVTLLSLTQYVGGDHNTSYRGDTYEIQTALEEAGVTDSPRFTKGVCADPRPFHKD